jgi:hypothetical protein
VWYAFKEAYIAVLSDDGSLTSVELIVNAMADMCDKEAMMGWDYVKHFRLNPDRSISRI